MNFRDLTVFFQENRLGNKKYLTNVIGTSRHIKVVDKIVLVVPSVVNKSGLFVLKTKRYEILSKTY